MAGLDRQPAGLGLLLVAEPVLPVLVVRVRARGPELAPDRDRSPGLGRASGPEPVQELGDVPRRYPVARVGLVRGRELDLAKELVPEPASQRDRRRVPSVAVEPPRCPELGGKEPQVRELVLRIVSRIARNHLRPVRPV